MENKTQSPYHVLVAYPVLPDAAHALYWTHDCQWGKPGEGQEYDIADLPNLINNVLPIDVPYTLYPISSDGLSRKITVTVIVSRVLQKEGKDCFWNEEESEWVNIFNCTRYLQIETNDMIESNLIDVNSFITSERLVVQHASFNEEFLRINGEFSTPPKNTREPRKPVDYASPLLELATSMLSGIKQDLIIWYGSQEVLSQAHRLDPKTVLSNAYQQLDASLVDSIVRRFADIEILICASLPSYSYNAEFDSVYNDIRSGLSNIRDEAHLEAVIENATKKVEEAISLLKKQEENKISFLDVLDSNRSSSRARPGQSFESESFSETRSRSRHREFRPRR